MLALRVVLSALIYYVLLVLLCILPEVFTVKIAVLQTLKKKKRKIETDKKSGEPCAKGKSV